MEPLSAMAGDGGTPATSPPAVMNPATHFERDILRQPAELQYTLALLTGSAQPQLRHAAALIRQSQHVFLTGIGASWHAAMGAGALFSQQGRPVHMMEAAELLHFASLPPDSLVIALSRSGRSIEIVQLLAKAGARLLGITNSPDSPLAKEAAASIVIPIALDHAISVNTYSTLALAAALVASCDSHDFEQTCASFHNSLAHLEDSIPAWRAAISASQWLAPHNSYYFLARGPSQASAHEARLLWEEGAKSPATAMNTSAFRHGPQEIVVPATRFCMWIDPRSMRVQDLSVADDLRKLGAAVALIGQDLPKDSGHLALPIPPVPAAWQFVVDGIPMQLAAEALSRLSGVDCDSFRVCSYVVEDEHGLLDKNGRRGGS